MIVGAVALLAVAACGRERTSRDPNATRPQTPSRSSYYEGESNAGYSARQTTAPRPPESPIDFGATLGLTAPQSTGSSADAGPPGPVAQSQSGTTFGGPSGFTGPVNPNQGTFMPPPTGTFTPAAPSAPATFGAPMPPTATTNEPAPLPPPSPTTTTTAPR